MRRRDFFYLLREHYTQWTNRKEVGELPQKQYPEKRIVRSS